MLIIPSKCNVKRLNIKRQKTAIDVVSALRVNTLCSTSHLLENGIIDYSKGVSPYYNWVSHEISYLLSHVPCIMFIIICGTI